jgi:hypothetical protein
MRFCLLWWEAFVDDPEDSLPLDEVGAWAIEKHERLRKYVDISRGARANFLPPKGTGGASYIDLYSGYGRAIIRDNGLVVDGSPLVAYRSALTGGAAFSEIHVADLSEEKMQRRGGPSCPDRGQREDLRWSGRGGH